MAGEIMLRPRESSRHQSNAPEHNYPLWLENARNEFNYVFRAAASQLDCPTLLADPVGLSVDLGRRIRPSLFYAFYETVSQEYPPPLAAKPGIAMELFHAASIIVDDMADGEICRRDKQPLHRKYGSDIATLTAHYLTASGYSILSKSDHADVLIGKWSERYAEACSGQINDYIRNSAITISEQQIASLRKTTSFFSFAGEIIDATRGGNKYARLFSILGEMFQIGNDVIDLLSFEQSSRHSAEESYYLRLSYLVPTLIEQGIISEDSLFRRLSYDEHASIARAASDVLPSSTEILDHRSRIAKKRVAEIDISPLEQAMAREFIDHCCLRSFWFHSHDK